VAVYRVAMKAALLLVATTAVAHADAKKDVEALVRAEAQVIDDKATAAPRASGAITVYPIHMSQNMRMNFYGGFADKIAHKVDKVVIGVVDAKSAWFHAIVIGTYEWTPCDGMGENCKKTTKERATWRLSGVAVDDQGWKLAAVMWSRAISDAELFKLSEQGGELGGVRGGQIDAHRVVAAWFGGGSIAKDISSSAQAIANGTAPAEIGQGAAAGKLAKAWDGLKMTEGDFSAKQWGSIAFVHGDVMLPVKKKVGDVVDMKLGAVLVLENGNWRWVAINFAPPDKQ
jgi:hypothetical protein